MNLSIRLIAAASLALSFNALASPADAQGAPAPLAWDCARAGVPTATEVSTHFGVRNLHKLHATQLHLRSVAQRACAGGAASLYIVARPAANGRTRYAAVAAR
jgi:hypothetical protein